MTNMRSHVTPIVHKTPYLIATWDDCGKSSYSGPCPTREPTASDDLADANEDFLVNLAQKLNEKVKHG